MHLPDFIVAGAPRSGTTWLYRLLDSHPSVAMAKPMRPEPKFFLRDELYARGLGYYHDRWFADLPSGRVIGEKSANYLESTEAAKRIAADLPGARLLFVLRDPVLRAYSNYLFSRQNGFETESFERALELEEERMRSLPVELRFTRPFSYYARGLYADMLNVWLALFPREQLLVLRTEDIASQPEQAARKVFDFLGVGENPGSAQSLGIINAAERTGAEVSPQVFQKLRERYRGPNARLDAAMGNGFTAAWMESNI